MPDLSWSHILLVIIVALVVVGPKDLPRLMRTLGRWTAQARKMADQFRSSFDEMARQAELDELKNELEALRSRRPFADVERELNQSIIPPDMASTPLASPPKPVVSIAETPSVEAPPADDKAQKAS
jgi:sec-independent protein translocase protein TatB